MEPQTHIENFLDRLRRLRFQSLLMNGVYIILSYITVGYLLTCMLVWAYKPSIELIWPLIGIFSGGLIYIVFSNLIKAFFTPFTRDDAALLAESCHTGLNNSLINSSQLGRRLTDSQYKNIATVEFIQELQRRTHTIVNKINPLAMVNRREIASGRNLFLSSLISLILIAILYPEFLRKGHEYWMNFKKITAYSQAQITEDKQMPLNPSTSNYLIDSLNLTFNFPYYTRIKTKTSKSPDGKISVLPGTEVVISATTNIPASGAELVSNDKDKFAMSEISKTTFKANLLVKKKGDYQFIIKDEKGIKHLLAKKYPVTLNKDNAPSIVLFLANPKPVYFNTDKVKFFYEGKDDFGISSVELIVFVNGKTETIPVKKFKNQNKEINESYAWNLAQISLNPGDNIQYYLEIKDNDNVLGPNTGQSEAYSFTIFDSEKEIENLIAMQEKMTEQMIALLATGLVKGASLKNQPGNLEGWKQLFNVSVDELIEIVSIAQRIQIKGETINRFPQPYLILLKNIISGLSNIRRNQIEALSDLQNTIYRPTQAKLKTISPYKLLNSQMIDHLEKDILFLVKMTNKQKLNQIIGLEERLNELTQTLREEFEKIKNSKSPQNSSELKNKVKKIRKTLQKIMTQLLRQRQPMQDEFLNPSALKRLSMEKFSSALEKMLDMINRGNINDAMKELKKMMEDLQILSSQLNHANSEMGEFLDPETMKTLDNSSKELDQLKERQQKLLEKTTKLNRDLQLQQSKQFKNELDKLFSDLLFNVDAIRKIFKKDEKLLQEHAAMRQLEKLISEEHKINQKINDLSQATVDATRSKQLDQNFYKLNEARKQLSSLTQEKSSLRVNEFQKLKEALPQLIKKYDSLSELATLNDLQEFSSHFKQTYPDVLRWQNNLRTAPDLRKDLSGYLDKDMRRATRINNEISKKLGSMMRSIRKNYETLITEKQKSKLDQMAKTENQLRNKTTELSQLLNKLSKINPMIPPELSQRMTQTSRHMKRAEKNLQKQNIRESIDAENQALEGLNDTRNMLDQMKSTNNKMGKSQRQTPRRLGTGSSPDSRRGGAQRLQKEQVLLPSEDQYQAPKEFREEILNAMKRQTPIDYQRMVMEYYKNLVK